MWLTLGTLGVIGAYLLLTPDGLNRAALAGLVVTSATAALMVLVLPLERIMRSSTGAVAFYAAGSVGANVVIAAAAALDGGGFATPLAAFFSLIIVYGALAYPPAGVIALGAVHLIGLWIFGLALSTSSLLVVSGLTVLTTAMCAVTAQTLRGHAAQLAELADRDGLTGCLNHRAFHARLEAEASRAERDGSALALIVFDVDHFKRVNDVHGHPVGDTVLAGVGRALIAAARSSDVVARLGGEEFAVLAPGSDLDSALALAERLHAAITQISEPVPVTASAGVSVLPSPARSAGELLDQADHALYQAKRAGRDQVAPFYEPAGPELAPLLPETNGDLALRVRDVIAHRRVTALYQPIVSLVDGRILAYEALARIEGSSVSPDVWLETAEEAGLRDELEAVMWDAAFAAGPPPAGAMLFVNASPKALTSGLLHRSRRKLPPYATIEVIERHTITDAADLARRLAVWTDEGVRVAIDDLGGGAGLDVHQMLALAPEYLKLDRSLVTGLRTEPTRAALVAALARFSQATGSHVIAEGIEDEADIAVLVAAGVAYGQGYLFARPAPPWVASLWRPAAARV